MKAPFLLIIMLSVLGSSIGGAHAGQMQVGIYNGDRRAVAVDDMAAVLRAEGKAVEYINKKEIETGSIYKYDVLIISGGWNATGWATYPLRLRLADYVNKGHGVLLTGFRCGPVRNISRPIFPETGVAYSKANTNGAVVMQDEHAVIRNLPERFYHCFWDHQVLIPGPGGQVLIKDTGGKALLIAGNEGPGRVVLCGFDFYKPEGALYRLFMNCIGWLGGACTGERHSEIAEAVELRVLRRERIWDYTHDDGGFDASHGVLANIKYDYETPLDILSFKLNDYGKYAETEAQKRLITDLKGRIAVSKEKLESNYQALQREVTDKFQAMDLVQLKNLPEGLQTNLLRTKMFNADDTEQLQGIVDNLGGQYRVRKEAARKQQEVEERSRDYAAVPGLMRNLISADIRIRAEAARELSRIGDKRSVEALIKAINDPVYEVSLNCIYALAWMQASEAVPALLRVTDGTDRWKRRRAVQALGLIGDRRALPKLERLRGDTDRYVAENAEFSIKWIGNGGIKQPGFLARQENFYWIRNKYHALYGRYFEYYGNRPRNPEDMIRYIKDAGGTGLITGCTNRALRFDGEEKFRGYLDAIEEAGLKWLENMPGKIPAGGQSHIGTKSANAEAIFQWFDQPAFAGFWGEEALYDFSEGAPWGEADRQEKSAAFRACLLKKYGVAALKEHGIDDLSKVELPEARNKNANKFLWAEFMDYAGEAILEKWREGLEWMHGLRKGISLTWSMSNGTFTSGKSSYFSIYPRFGEIFDASGPEDYASHSVDNMFFADLARNGEVRPVMTEYYQMQLPDNDWLTKGLAASFLHGESFFVWNYAQVFKYPADKRNAYLWGWDKGRWEVCRDIFNKSRNISDYLAGTDSPKKVALLHSGRTQDLIYSDPVAGADGLGGQRGLRYNQHQVAVYRALLQSHIQADVVWLETLEQNKMAGYKAAILFDAKSLTKDQTILIRNWVREGGVLISSGTTSLFDRWGNLQRNYALADVFGVTYDKTVPSIPKEGELHKYVDRDLKPDMVGRMEMDDTLWLHHFRKGDVVECDLSLGYDIVKPTTGRVAARISHNGEPAVVMNDFGKGKSIFIAPIYPGLALTTMGAAVHTMDAAFWPGARELISGAVTGGLAAVNDRLVYRASNCRREVEVAVRTQDAGKRWIVHLFDYGPTRAMNADVKLDIFYPAAERKKLKVYYPYPAVRDIEYEITGEGAVRIKVRDFDIHEMLVIEEDLLLK